MKTMNVFISWSGELSQKVGKILNQWIPNVLPEVEIRFSPDSINKGDVWFNDINFQLSETGFGILVLTKQNITSPWIHYEAGILSKGLSWHCVCPFLVNLKTTDLKPPLSNFNCALHGKDEILNLIKSIHSHMDSVFKWDQIERLFQHLWIDFDNEFSSALKNYSPEEPSPKRSTTDMVIETLELVRSIQRQLQLKEPVPVDKNPEQKDIDSHNNKIEAIKADIKANLEGLQEEKVINEKAWLVFYRQINSEYTPPEKFEDTKSHLIRAFSPASQEILTQISGFIEAIRERNVYMLLGAKEDDFVQTKCRNKLANLIPLLEALIEVSIENLEKSEKYSQLLHDYYAHLAYIYKDSSARNWEKALDYINKAIEERDREHLDRVFLIMYEINRIIFCINMLLFNNFTIKEEKENIAKIIEKDFNWVWRVDEGKTELMRIHPLLAPNLREWLINNKLEEISEWFNRHPASEEWFKKREEWFNSVPSKFRKKLESKLNNLDR